MLIRIATTFMVIAICLADARAELPSFYGYWPTGGGTLTIAPVRGPTRIGGVEFVAAEPGLLTFGGDPAPFNFRIPNSLNPGGVTLGVLGTGVSFDGPTQLDITVSAAAGFEDVVIDGINFPDGPLGPCGPDEDCLALILPIAAECDINEDGFCNALDIDSLSSAIQSGDAPLAFDLNEDGVVNDGDRNYWIESIQGTLSGDANLDGRVLFADFLALSDNFGESGGWTQGDFDGDGQVEFTDFLVLSKNFGLPPVGISAVPEPSSLGTTLFGLLACTRFIRRNRKKHSC